MARRAYGIFVNTRTFSRAKNAMHAAGRDIADDAAENYGPGVMSIYAMPLCDGPRRDITILA